MLIRGMVESDIPAICMMACGYFCTDTVDVRAKFKGYPDYMVVLKNV